MTLPPEERFVEALSPRRAALFVADGIAYVAQYFKPADRCADGVTPRLLEVVRLWATSEGNDVDVSSTLTELTATVVKQMEKHEQWAAWAAECPPGFPRDAESPYYYSGLSALCQAASLCTTEPTRAFRFTRSAVSWVGYEYKDRDPATEHSEWVRARMQMEDWAAQPVAWP